jgi:hypothetical protein
VAALLFCELVLGRAVVPWRERLAGLEEPARDVALAARAAVEQRDRGAAGLARVEPQRRRAGRVPREQRAPLQCPAPGDGLGDGELDGRRADRGLGILFRGIFVVVVVEVAVGDGNK